MAQAGSVAEMQRLRNGIVLVKVKDVKQAAALQEVEKIGEIGITVTTHTHHS